MSYHIYLGYPDHPDYPRNGSVLRILFNWLLCLSSNVRVPLVGEVSVGVKPVQMIHGGVGAHPALHRGVEPTCCIYYGLFSHTNSYGLRCGAVSSSSLAHPQLVHIYENILVYNFHLLKILHYLCVSVCFINSTSWNLYNRILQYFCL